MNTIKLVDITTKIGSGATPRGGKSSYKTEGISLIRSLNVLNFTLSVDELAFIDDDQAAQLSNVKVERNDILLNITGASVARCCMVPDHVLPARVNQHVAIVRTDKEKADPFFVQYVLTSLVYKKQLLNLAQGGATREALTKSTIENFKIPFPPIRTQRKVTDILSAYDDLIENNTRRIKILEEVAQRIYSEWFVHFRFPGHENVKMVDSGTEFGMIPEGWEVMSLGNFAREVRRSVDPKELDPSTPHFGLEHLPRRSIALSDWGFANEIQSTKLAFKKEEILFGKIRPYFHKVGVAPLDGICSTDTIVIVVKEPRYYFLVLGCVSSTEFVNHATQTSQGTKMPRANWNVLVKYPLVSPVEAVLNDFNELMQAIIDQIINCIFRNRNLRQTRNLLLPKLISGKIDVKDLDIDVV